MKSFLHKISFASILLIACAATAGAQSAADKKAAIQNLVESQSYVFKAQTALPLSGRSRHLTSDYDLRVSKASIISYLPYFGRAYAPPIDPTQGGIQFTSKAFDYKMTPGKKGGWTVVIKPSDIRDVQRMTLSISSAGYTTLQVTSMNRQAISFNGVIEAPH